jgi:hypothetical protein
MSLQLLPKIYYDLAIRGENSIPVIIPDVMVRVEFSISEEERKQLFFDYTILDGETPEIISHKFYNTMDYNWVIMLINRRFDYIGDFPISYNLLFKHCQEKYGVDSVYDIHHYEDPYGNIVDELYYDYTNSQGFQPTGILAEEPIWKSYSQYADFGFYRGEWKIGIVYSIGEIVKSVSTNDVPTDSYWRCQIAHTSANDGTFEPVDYDELTPQQDINSLYWTKYVGSENRTPLKGLQGLPITNFQYEDNENEKKRKIRLIKADQIGTFVKRYEEALLSSQ